MPCGWRAAEFRLVSNSALGLTHTTRRLTERVASPAGMRCTTSSRTSPSARIPRAGPFSQSRRFPKAADGFPDILADLTRQSGLTCLWRFHSTAQSRRSIAVSLRARSFKEATEPKRQVAVTTPFRSYFGASGASIPLGPIAPGATTPTPI
jgi:hypothetical protein